MIEIIERLIADLNTQRSGVLMEIQELDQAHMNYAIKRTDLSIEIANIDGQINQHLTRLEAFLNNTTRNNAK